MMIYVGKWERRSRGVGHDPSARHFHSTPRQMSLKEKTGKNSFMVQGDQKEERLEVMETRSSFNKNSNNNAVVADGLINENNGNKRTPILRALEAVTSVQEEIKAHGARRIARQRRRGKAFRFGH